MFYLVLFHFFFSYSCHLPNFLCILIFMLFFYIYVSYFSYSYHLPSFVYVFILFLSLIQFCLHISLIPAFLLVLFSYFSFFVTYLFFSRLFFPLQCVLADISDAPMKETASTSVNAAMVVSSVATALMRMAAVSLLIILYIPSSIASMPYPLIRSLIYRTPS